MPTQFDLVLREETLANERRTVLTPEHVAKLTARGFKVALAHWPERVFSEKEYIDTVQRNGNQNNFAVIDPEDWKTQTPYENSLIVGVKEIVEAPIGSSQYGLKHIYIHFDHSYKGQQHAEERLGRFIGGYTPHLKDIFTAANRNSRSPLLLDHEYCVDENGQRTHAFGKSAGFATTAMSLMSWAQKINEEAFVLEQFSYDKKEKFFALLKSKMEAAPSLNQWPPKILVLGSERGRSARGCLEFIKELNGYLELKNPLDYDLWGRSETQNRQTSDGLDGITDFDVVINCTFAAQACEPFITDKTITNRHDPDRPIIIGDVTCDATPDKNRIRVSSYRNTDFDAPAFEALRGSNVHLITVDHSPSLFPRESTIDMANQFFPHILDLLTLKHNGREIRQDLPWGQALKAFNDNMRTPVAAYKIGETAPLTTPDFNAHVQSQSTTLRRTIANYLKIAPALRPSEQSAFMFYVAMGMVAACSDMKIDRDIENLRDTLERQISLADLTEEDHQKSNPENPAVIEL